MSRVFITGSTDGLGLAAAETLIGDGHEVVLHARSESRAAVFDDLAGRAEGVAGVAGVAGVVVGDLSSDQETRSVAEQVNAVGRMDAVIHNAGVYLERERFETADGHARVLAVNVLAPYLLTCLVERPSRLVYVTSGMHHDGGASLDDIEWTRRRWSPSGAYSESKLLLTALAFAVSRLWPDVRSNAVTPGWVPTKMGGPAATDDLSLGHVTQVWLAASDDPSAAVTGGYWFHQRQESPAPATRDAGFQDRLLERLAELTGVVLPR